MTDFFDRPQPRQLRRLYKIYTHSPTNLFNWPCGVCTTSWEREARENARIRAEQSGLPIYDLPPNISAQRALKLLPPAVYVVHEVVENAFGDTIRENFGRLYDDDDIARMVEAGPPELAELVDGGQHRPTAHKTTRPRKPDVPCYDPNVYLPFEDNGG